MKDKWYPIFLCLVLAATVSVSFWFITAPNSVQGYYIQNHNGVPCVVADSVWFNDYPAFCSPNVETVFHTLDELKSRLEAERKGK